jgi:hypothetical protein
VTFDTSAGLTSAPYTSGRRARMSRMVIPHVHSDKIMSSTGAAAAPLRDDLRIELGGRRRMVSLRMPARRKALGDPAPGTIPACIAAARPGPAVERTDGAVP